MPLCLLVEPVVVFLGDSMGSVIPGYVALRHVCFLFHFLLVLFHFLFFFSPSFRAHFGCWKVVYNKDRMNVTDQLCRRCTVIAHEKTNKVKKKVNI